MGKRWRSAKEMLSGVNGQCDIVAMWHIVWSLSRKATKGGIQRDRRFSAFREDSSQRRLLNKRRPPNERRSFGQKIWQRQISVKNKSLSRGLPPSGQHRCVLSVKITRETPFIEKDTIHSISLRKILCSSKGNAAH